MNYSKRENSFEKLQTLCNHLKDGMNEIKKAFPLINDSFSDQGSRDNAREKLLKAQAQLQQALEASREALGEVGETYNDAGFIEQSGADFAEKVVLSVYTRLKSVLEPLSKPF